MTGLRPMAIGVLALIVACSPEPPVPTSVVALDPTPTPAAVVVEPTPTPTTPDPSRTPTPSPTPVPVPPKPAGLRLSEEIEGICDDSAPGDTCAVGDSSYTLTWTAPSSKGVQIRVYGVTKCFPGEYPLDRKCIRRHTALPESVRVLLAKAPASRGAVSWREAPGGGACVQYGLTANGARVYSVVVAAYNDSGHSIFTIVDAGWKDRDCDW